MNLKYLGNKNVLIIENDILNVKLISAILRKVSDMDLILSDNGSDALTILESGNIDIVLLNTHLLQENGKDILQNIRNNRNFDNLPVFIISSDGLAEGGLREIGANNFILKPFCINQFISKFATHFETRKIA